MLALNDIINISLRRSNLSGYRTENIDAFTDQMKGSYDQLLKKTMGQARVYETLANEKKELERKLSILAEKIEGYRQEEGEIKTALVSTQKLGESSVREARHKIKIILRDANSKAKRILDTAKANVVEQQHELDGLKGEVTEFRAKLLMIHKEYLVLIDVTPSRKEELAQEGSHVAAELEKEQEEPEQQNHCMPEEPPVFAEPGPEYTPELEKDDFSVDVVVFDIESPNRNLCYDVLKFDEVDEFGEE